MDVSRARTLIDRTWEESIVPTLCAYIEIPNQSPLFDPQWARAGHMDRAVELALAWCREQPVRDMQLEIVRLPGRTPVLLAEIPGASERTVLLYGHLDKQPPMHGWEPGLGPWTPVLRDGKLYGRGGADDGYATFASLTALAALQEQGVPHARCVVLIECCEESGSPDLPAYIEALGAQIGTPDLVVCLDSGCGDYERLWATTSLRGLVIGTLRVDVLDEGVHSGDASGVVPSSFRIARQLIERLEDGVTGAVRPSVCHVDIPDERVTQADAAAEVLGASVYGKFPFARGAGPTTRDLRELVLARTWRPALSVTGQAGLPALESAGNVQRPFTAFKLSLRLPPTCDAAAATARLAALLEADPPYGARVAFDAEPPADGWNAPELSPWLAAAMERASRAAFGEPACFMGEGGSIPFMAMLGRSFPEAQFLITGVLGPKSNAHGPNEFLHLETGKRLTCCVASVLADHLRRPERR